MTMLNWRSVGQNYSRERQGLMFISSHTTLGLGKEKDSNGLYSTCNGATITSNGEGSENTRASSQTHE